MKKELLMKEALVQAKKALKKRRSADWCGGGIGG